MRYRTLSRLSLAPLLVLALTTFTAPVFAQGNSGKGGAKDGGTVDPPPPPPFTYSIGWLESEDFAETHGATRAINGRGDTVGYALDEDRTQTAVVHYADLGLFDLNLLLVPDSGWHLRLATSINDSGQITGSGTFHGERAAFRFSPAFTTEEGETVPEVIEEIPALYTGGWIGAESINQWGDVLGIVEEEGGRLHAYVFSGWSSSGELVLTGVSATDVLYATAINNWGQFVGSIPKDGTRVAYRYTPGEGIEYFPTTLVGSKTKISGYSSHARDIDDQGNFVGEAKDSRTTNAPFFHDGIVMQNLGKPDGHNSGIATATSAAGIIIGHFGSQAYVHVDGVWFDLESMIDSPLLGSSGYWASEINASGQIAGWATWADGTRHGFVLTPQSMEPSSQ